MEVKRDSKESLQDFITELNEASAKKGKGKALKLVNTLFDSDMQVISWKFNEWDYGKDKIQLPSKARGLFTTFPESSGTPQIITRGYDKFFNIDEVSQTKLSNLRESTAGGSYELSLKENGCIIFISGLANGELVVCSKHSTGDREDLTRNHALRGKYEIENQLIKLGKSKKELAEMLYTMNLTAVAELCDDSFEEHVLEYSKDQAGLYLHGLNHNTIQFSTLPMSQVSEFATAWGFQKVGYLVKQNFNDLIGFLEECGKTGTYEGREIEGFVIRSKLTDGSDYFFKYKFEEPYMMYRQFREATRAYLNGVEVSDIKIHKHLYATTKYLEFVVPILDADSTIGKRYQEGYGIIQLRNKFLESSGQKGIELANVETTLPDISNLGLGAGPRETKYVFISVATIGCGKTTTFQTLQNLYPEWAHVQNDNITSKAKNKLTTDCLEALSSTNCPVVLCDRNNHQFRERLQLFNDFSTLKRKYVGSNVDLKFICLNFVSDGERSKDIVQSSKPDTKLWDISQERILSRGDNHQSIHVSDGETFVKGIMKGFVSRFQPVNSAIDPDCRFDLIINLKVDSENSSLSNAITVLEQINKTYPELVAKLPTHEEINTAFHRALSYKPSIQKFMGGKRKDKTNTNGKNSNNNGATSNKKKSLVTYYAISIQDPINLMLKIDELFTDKFTLSDQVTPNLAIWQALRQLDRVQHEFHVTLAHKSSTGKNASLLERQLWEEYTDLFTPKITDAFSLCEQKSNPKPESIELDHYADVKLKSLVFDERLICIKIEITNSYILKDGEFVATPAVFRCGNIHPHITIGTMSPDVKPFLSNQLLNDVFFESEIVGDGCYDGKYIYNWEDDVVLEKMKLIAYI